jgi:demethylmenaquinone methyltransferase / 2-methoxy-6-polyprenyl-1,4-benzoquinol methylase
LNHFSNTGHPLQSYYSRIYKSYDLINRLFTFGLDKKWRRHTVEVCMSKNPASVLDLCCGTGDLTIGMAKRAGKNIRIIGYDLNRNMLNRAELKAKKEDLSFIEFVQGDAASMPFANEEFDCITIGFGFRNLIFENPNREKNIHEIGRIMKAGAFLLILESSSPKNKWINVFYNLYLKFILIPIGGLLSQNVQAYKYLAGSSAGFYTIEQIQEFMKEDFTSLKVEKSFLFGAANLIVAIKKGI